MPDPTPAEMASITTNAELAATLRDAVRTNPHRDGKVLVTSKMAEVFAIALERTVPGLSLIPVEEATHVERPNGHPWVWPEPARAISCDSGGWSTWPRFHPEHGPIEDRIAVAAIENLYRAGFVLVKLPGGDDA
jgi:hypothetical protein